MNRRFCLRIALAAAMLLALAAPAYAGGVAVTLDSPPKDVQAGVAFTFGFMVRSAHEDRTLIDGLAPLISASNPAKDAQATTTAQAEGARGHYVATLTLPAEGSWQWQMHPFGKDDMSYTLALPGPLRVGAKGAPSQPATQARPAKVVDAKGIDDAFAPVELTITAGTAVRWSMAGKLPHTVTAVDGAFASGNLDPGQSYAFTFAEPGTYAYYCDYHGTRAGQGMFGKIIVTAAADQPAAPAALPRTGGREALPWLVLLAALLAGGLGLALRLRRRAGAV
jgi:LPXTG-motif cell wall-anchored protein